MKRRLIKQEKSQSSHTQKHQRVRNISNYYLPKGVFNVIVTEGLTRHYGEIVAVDNLTMKIKSGEIFGFLGPNGAGKTTTVRVLCCLISITAGNAFIGDYQVGKPEDSLKIRKMVGLLPENAGLYERLSAYRNLDFYGKLYEMPETRRKENIEHFLRMLGLWERKDQIAGTFSKGMKQKIALARALIHDPEIIFLDEPTAGLDPEAAQMVRNFILELKKEKRTIFLNTHNLDEADKICDRIGLIKTKLIRIASPEDLKKGLWSRKTAIQLHNLNDTILTTVKQLDSVKSFQTMDNKLILEVDDPEKENPSIIEAIIKAGGKIVFVTEVRPSLEDVYLKLIKEA